MKRYYIVMVRWLNDINVHSHFTEMNPYEYFAKLKRESKKKLISFIDFHEVTKEYTEWLEIKEEQIKNNEEKNENN